MSTIKRRTETPNYHKHDYFEALHLITPKVYVEEDLALSGFINDPITDIINSHLNVANNISSIINITPVAGGIYSAINTLNGIAPFFVKQNQLTEITPDSFEKSILLPLNVNFGSFDSSADFSTYLRTTLLPGMTLNSPTIASHSSLITNLNWFYFLNQGVSSFVHDSFVDKLYKGQSLYLVDAMYGLAELLNQAYATYLPSDYQTHTGIYTSGTQQLDKLKTWLYIIYSPLYSDASDYRVKDAFDNYIDSRTIESTLVAGGPLARLLRAFSFGFYDFNDEVERIKTFNDIDECPENQLHLLADLIGWRLFSFDPDRWRVQLKNAVDIYKKVGTKASIQFAANTIFSKDVFNVTTRITEMWESYVPYLIYYSLATESDYFKSNSTWTQSLAHSMGVGTYSISSFDENLRLVTDSIILDVVKEFPTLFKFKGKAFPLRDSNFTFFYRGRNYSIPPFEEYPYYVNTEFTEEQIDFIADRLACFGVRQVFALEVAQYLKDNALNADDDIRLDNSWLLFTSGYNTPPNFSQIVGDLTNQRTQYLPLWSGKSSHFKLSFNASEFDFAKDSLELDSKNALPIVADIVGQFSPAHAIPDILLNASTTDTTYEYDNNFPYLDLPKADFASIGAPVSSTLTAGEVSGFDFVAMKRGSSTGNRINRSSVDSLSNQIWVAASGINNLNRRSFRHRSLDNVLPKQQWYSRTGFNMPTTWEVSSLGDNQFKFMPLGFIPSSLSYQSISDYRNLPQVYQSCFGLGSPSSFFGVAVSNTYPCRGYTTLSSPDYYVDRGQLEPIIAVMHDLKEQSKVQLVSALFYNSPEVFYENSSWKNTIQSYINSATEYSDWFPNLMSDYYNFSFGRDFHLLYKDYTSKFNRHNTYAGMVDLNGPNIIAHTFGSIFRNSDFNLEGSITGLIASSVDTTLDLVGHRGYFTQSGAGTYIASSTSSMYVDNYEYRNANILSGVELVHTSGIFAGNSFTLYKLAKQNQKWGQADYLFDNAFIKLKSADGLPRVRFDLRNYGNPSAEGHPINTNLLIPDHKFSFNIKALASNDTGYIAGGSRVGIWVHTQSEGGKSWSYSKDGVWVQHDSLVSKEDLFNKYAHEYAFNDVDVFTEVSGASAITLRYRCIELATSAATPGVILNFTENDFVTKTLEFNTCNTFISLPDSYYRNYGQLHRPDQNYIIEIFKYPTADQSKFIILDAVNFYDATLNLRSQILVSGVSTGQRVGKIYCPEFRVVTTPEQLLTIIRYFNDISGGTSKIGYASRNATITSSFLETSGGSRVDYMINPDTLAPTKSNEFITLLTVGI